MTDAPELSPCPFCGGVGSIYRDYCHDGGGIFLSVRCNGCESKSPEQYFSHGNDCPQTYQEARGKWNTRTDHSQALIAAAYEAAAKVCEAPIECGCSACNGRHDEARISLDFAGENVRALTPANAQAALDKLIADAERRGMERAAEMVTSYEVDVAKWNTQTPPGCSKVCGVVACETVASAIRAAMEDKKP